MSPGWMPRLGLRKATRYSDLVAPPYDVIPDHTAQTTGWGGLIQKETLWAGSGVFLKGQDLVVSDHPGVQDVLSET